MKAKTRWIMAMVAVGLAGALFFTLFAGQQAPQTPQTQKPVTLEEVYALLVTEDGQNRLDVIEKKLADLDEKMDILYKLETEVHDDATQEAEETSWTLSDMMFLLHTLDSKLDDLLTP